MADVRAGRAFVELSLQDNLTKGMNAAAATLKGFGTRVAEVGAVMSGIGAAITAPFIAATKSFADAGSRLYDLSQRTGLSVEALSALKYAAEQSGSSLEAVEVAIKKMEVGLTKAADGSKEMIGALDDIGLKVSDFQGMNPEQMFAKISGAIAAIPDPARKAAAAVALFGKSGTQLLPMLQDFRALSAEAQKNGLIMSTETAKAADALGDAFGLLGETIKFLGYSIGAALAPALTTLAKDFAEVVAGIARWAAENRALIVEAAQVAAAITAAGVAFTGFGLAIYGAGVAIATFTPLASAALAVLGLLGAPLASIGVAVVALGGYFLATSGIWQDVFQGFKTTFAEIGAIASTAFGGIADALKAGDMAAAAKILWLGLKAIWQEGVDAISAVFDQLRYYGRSVLNGLQSDAVGLLKDLHDLLPAAISASRSLGARQKQLELEQAGLAAAFTKGGPAGQESDALKAAKKELAIAVDDARIAAATPRPPVEAPGAQGGGFNANPSAETAAQEASRKATEEARAGEAFTAKVWEDMAEAQKRDDAEFLAIMNQVAEGVPNAVAGLPDELQAALQEQAATTAGTFNLAGGFGEGAISAQDRTAKATEDTARNTKRLNDTMKDAIPAFT
jgi:TP901 family phage tail tape measure protein